MTSALAEEDGDDGDDGDDGEEGDIKNTIEEVTTMARAARERWRCNGIKCSTRTAGRGGFPG